MFYPECQRRRLRPVPKIARLNSRPAADAVDRRKLCTGLLVSTSVTMFFSSGSLREDFFAGVGAGVLARGCAGSSGGAAFAASRS